jgi:hypothetical protein
MKNTTAGKNSAKNIEKLYDEKAQKQSRRLKTNKGRSKMILTNRLLF